MARVLITGGAGLVGQFIVESFLTAGHDVIVAGRNKPGVDFFSKPVGFLPFDLEPEKVSGLVINSVDILVHGAFSHVPGRYRGGEGKDKQGFIRRNLDGTNLLFEIAKQQRVSRAFFLSSRAVYGQQQAGSMLYETTCPHPDTLYGEVKLSAERALQALCDDTFCGTSLRITGVYGVPKPEQHHKWYDLFQDYVKGKAIAPRVSTEVHGGDVASAMLCLLQQATDKINAEIFNISDLVIDRRELLLPLQQKINCQYPLPEHSDAASLNVMNTDKLRKYGWQPRGISQLRECLNMLLQQYSGV